MLVPCLPTSNVSLLTMGLCPVYLAHEEKLKYESLTD